MTDTTMKLADIHIGKRHRKTLRNIEALATSIAATGLLHPVVVKPNGELIAGERRIAAYHLLERDEIPVHIIDLENMLLAERDENVQRMDFTPSEAVAIAAELEPIERAAAAERQGTRTDLEHGVNFTPCEAGKARDKVAEAVGMSHPTLAKATAVVLAAEENPEKFGDLVEKMDKSGKVDAAAKELKKRKRHEKRRQDAQEHAGIKDDRVITGDFRTAGISVADDSIDLIFTDPPYDEKSIPLYGDLAQFAARVLRPGGSLIVYAGHYALPQIFELMCPHLRYWWIIACKHNGASARLPGKWVFVEWKPLLWFVKGGRSTTDYVADLNESKPVDKTQHDWQQSTVEARYYIEKLTEPGGVVADPFCGSGTTLLAAAQAGRQFIGLEKDTDAAIIARQRIAEYQAGRAS